MTTVLGAYDPTFYAQEALLLLENVLGMGLRVHRGFENERTSKNVGQTIQVKKPMAMTTQAGGNGTVADVSTEYVDITLDKWREVKFGLTDKELAYTGERIIQDHISPAVYALANYVDTQMTALYKYIPWSTNLGSTVAYSDYLATRKILRDVGGTLIDMGDVHFAIDSTLEAGYLGLNLFNDASTGAGTEGLIRGSLGMRAGVQPFVNQNLPSHTGGTVLSAGTDAVGALNADGAKGDTTVSIDGLSLVETIKAGDSFVIAGHTQRYVVTSDITLSSGAHATVPIYPALVKAYAENDVVTFEAQSSSVHSASYYANIMFHRNAFCLAFAPLPEIGDGAGARMSVVTDPRTGMSVRSRLAYDDTYAKVVVTLDILFGCRCLDPNMAVIARRDK